MSSRIAAFSVWALAAACAVYWALRLLAAPAGLPASVQPVSITGALKGDIGRLFASPGTPVASEEAAPALTSRFKLVGVMAPREGEGGRGQGIALIAVDGKPPRPYRVGASLESGIVLQAVAARSATLGPLNGAATVRLDMPTLPAPATGTRLPSAGLISQFGAPGGASAMSPSPGNVMPGGAATPASPGEAPVMPVDALPPETAPANQR